MRTETTNLGDETIKASEIKIGGRYTIKVSGRIVTVQVLRTVERSWWQSNNRHSVRTNWVCRNLTTGREIVVRSAQRFRGTAAPQPTELAYPFVV